eukprot:CAMPEP_0178994802 /NCGR_PEP_ID=MMETSP0795-20121207/7473_1 /TAXON_ID=88552 /ORGANISM="Amoebophrya sp., Strain Ameob2" /LENGTH=579 /DNA_ID=CAMNT_0020687037 /DNA_START=90 /DNA_END=1826 /DNA_ORIENTATION=+
MPANNKPEPDVDERRRGAMSPTVEDMEGFLAQMKLEMTAMDSELSCGVATVANRTARPSSGGEEAAAAQHPVEDKFSAVDQHVVYNSTRSSSSRTTTTPGMIISPLKTATAAPDDDGTSAFSREAGLALAATGTSDSSVRTPVEQMSKLSASLRRGSCTTFAAMESEDQDHQHGDLLRDHFEGASFGLSDSKRCDAFRSPTSPPTQLGGARGASSGAIDADGSTTEPRSARLTVKRNSLAARDLPLLEQRLFAEDVQVSGVAVARTFFSTPSASASAPPPPAGGRAEGAARSQSPAGEVAARAGSSASTASSRRSSVDEQRKRSAERHADLLRLRHRVLDLESENRSLAATVETVTAERAALAQQVRGVLDEKRQAVNCSLIAVEKTEQYYEKELRKSREHSALLEDEKKALQKQVEKSEKRVKLLEMDCERIYGELEEAMIRNNKPPVMEMEMLALPLPTGAPTPTPTTPPTTTPEPSTFTTTSPRERPSQQEREHKRKDDEAQSTESAAVLREQVQTLKQFACGLQADVDALHAAHEGARAENATLARLLAEGERKAQELACELELAKETEAELKSQ